MADQSELLAQSTDMNPVAGTVDVAIPIDLLWECFTHADAWPRWNPCMFWVRNPDLVLGQELIWVFEPMRWWYFYKLPARARIVELEPKHKVTWEVRFIPGFYARHTYSLDDLGDGRTRFGSSEQAMGSVFRLLQWFWLAHFEFVKDRSLEGARSLEARYQQNGPLDIQKLPPKDYFPSLLWGALVVLLILKYKPRVTRLH
ncbi:MAG: SRPBCC family protein [Chloroflexota bacterium]